MGFCEAWPWREREFFDGVPATRWKGKLMIVGKKILLVDDDDDLRSLTRTVLTNEGYSVVEAGNCTLAFDLLRSQQFALVLLDITLPDGNGLRVAEFIRENKLDCKVIVVTGTTGLANALKGISIGIRDYIAKPFTLEYLMRSIEHVLSTEATSQGSRDL